MRTFASCLALFVCLGALATYPPASRAQEFNCDATVNIDQLSGNDFNYLEELDERVEEYVNRHRWTQDRYEEAERIDCDVQITLAEATSLTSFRGNLTVAMRRPIYGTSQYTTVVQFIDSDLQFGYSQGTPLIHDLERYNPLTSVLDFYMYVLLGYDYDTFSEYGGTPHFETARRIAERAQSLGHPGWSAIGTDQGRSNLVSQILDPRYRPLRLAYFTYHYGGLDHFVSETDAARTRVITVLESLQELYELVSRSYALDMFFAAKYREMTAIFMDSPIENQAYALLSELDPSHLTEYNQLVQ